MAVRYSISLIVEKVQQTMKKYGESDPFRLAKAMGIIVKYQPMGLEKGCCKGFFIVHKRIKLITVNCDLPTVMQRIVLAHEIGHAVLHSESGALAPFTDSTLFDAGDFTEFEANVFASELLLPDEDVVEALNEDAYFQQIAAQLNVPWEMLDFKFRVMKKKGFVVNAPYLAQANFLKDFENQATNVYDNC